MFRIALTLMVSFLALSSIQAQDLGQEIRVKIHDEDTYEALVGASVEVFRDGQFIKGAVADSDGRLVLNGIKIGYVDLRVRFLGYETKWIQNIYLNSAKEQQLEVYLRESVIQLDSLVVQTEQSFTDALNENAIVSARSINTEQSSRYAGGFNDPSKIVSNFAGVTATPNGGNDIIIRANAPKYVQWRLEGAEITNPNHFGDPNATSGIVGALNNNLISISDFYTAAFPAEIGNALSGVYDVRLRKGNNQKYEGIFGFGLLGTDLTLEGPIKKGYKGSFIANYRYSTLGAANKAGLVEVDGANLSFQDAAFKISLPTKKMGQFSLYGLQGSSEFLFEEVDPSIWVTPNDDYATTEQTEDYRKKAYLLNLGANHLIALGKQTVLHSTLFLANEGIYDRVYQNMPLDRIQTFKLKMNKERYSLKTTLSHKINAKNKVEFGFQWHHIREEMIQNKAGQNKAIVDYDRYINRYQSYTNYRYRPSDKLTLVAGLHFVQIPYNMKSNIEPRLAVAYKSSKNKKWTLAFGRHSKMERFHHYFYKENGRLVNPKLDLLKADHLVMGFQTRINTKLNFKIEAYYQRLYDLAVENDNTSSFSTINEGLDFRYVDLVNEGTGKNYGVEFSIDRRLNRGFYYLANLSIYNSKYTALDGIERNTMYNGRYLLNILAGKQFDGLGKKKNQSLAINTKVFFGGARPFVPLSRGRNNRLAVDVEQGIIYDESRAYQQTLDNILNAVFSVSYKWNRKRTTHELYLNIDNITNHRARLYEYYDQNKNNNIGYKKQEGIIPNLLYRVYF